MAKNKDTKQSVLAELFKAGLYKRNQGRLVRQLTAAGLAVVLFFGLWTLSQGPLANYVSTYQAVNISYQASEADESIDSKIKDVVTEKGGEIHRQSLNLERREISARFPTSKMWVPDTELGEEAVKKISEINQELSKEYGPQLTISGAIAQSDRSGPIRLGIPIILGIIGSWIIYRAVNYPVFADFLIAVEGEMSKVTWASKDELYRSTIVVVAAMFLLGLTLFLFDAFWQWFFQIVNFLRTGTPEE